MINIKYLIVENMTDRISKIIKGLFDSFLSWQFDYSRVFIFNNRRTTILPIESESRAASFRKYGIPMRCCILVTEKCNENNIPTILSHESIHMTLLKLLNFSTCKKFDNISPNGDLINKICYPDKFCPTGVFPSY